MADDSVSPTRSGRPCRPASPLRAWWILEKAALRAEAQYRSNLFVGFLGGFTYQGIQLAFMALLLSRFGVIGGWGFREIGLLMGIRLAAHAVYLVPFGSVERVPMMVHDGEFDRVLMRPASMLTQIITSRFHLMGIGDAFIGVASLIVFGMTAPIQWDPWRIAYLVFAVIGGGLVETALMVFINAFAFKFTNVQSITYFVNGSIITNFGVYPLTIFGTAGLIALCIAPPLAFISYLPTTVLLGRASEVPLPTWLVDGSPLAGWLLLGAALWVFGRLARSYKSPGS